MKRSVFIGVTLVLLATAGWSLLPVSILSAAPKNPRPAVMHLSHFTDDLHAAFMAFKLATMMQNEGTPVTLFADLEGARLADGRVSLEVTWGPSETTLGKYYDTFVDAGGKVLICPHCAHAVGVDESNLREGASIATAEQIGAMLRQADKIMDY